MVLIGHAIYFVSMRAVPAEVLRRETGLMLVSGQQLDVSVDPRRNQLLRAMYRGK